MKENVRRVLTKLAHSRRIEFLPADVGGLHVAVHRLAAAPALLADKHQLPEESRIDEFQLTANRPRRTLSAGP